MAIECASVERDSGLEVELRIGVVVNFNSEGGVRMGRRCDIP